MERTSKLKRDKKVTLDTNNNNANNNYQTQALVIGSGEARQCPNISTSTFPRKTVMTSRSSTSEAMRDLHEVNLVNFLTSPYHAKG